MKHLLMALTVAAATAAAIAPALAQVPQTAALPPQSPAPAPYYGGGAYPFAPTAEDAYRDGSITRWDYERVAGPLPPALQGPPVDGNRGSGGGDRE
jgi:hypothetical protein